MNTPFTRRVYNVVLKIPLGETRTYQWVAWRSGSPGAARAVGQVLKRNPYPLIIPCHRVVGSGGKMCGYSGAGGIKRKRELLELESKIRKNML